MITPFDYIERKLFWLCVALIPFSSTKFLLPLGELSTDASSQVALLGSLFFLVAAMFKSKVPVIKNYWILAFLLWSIISGFYNYSEILQHSFKGKIGWVKYVTQFAMFFFFSVPILHFLLNNISKYSSVTIEKKARNILMFVFYFSSFYAAIEILVGIYHIGSLHKVYNILNILILKYKSQSWNLGRISGITQEPPFLAMYLIFISPWAFTEIIKRTTLLKYIPLGLIFMAAFYSGSRTAFIIISLQFLVFVLLSFKKKKYSFKMVELIGIIFFISVLGILLARKQIETKVVKTVTSVTNEKQTNKHKVSNITRWGTQKAAIKTFEESPVFGVGLGQQAYFLIKNYDKQDIKKSWELQYYIDPAKKLWPPGYSMFTRLLSELGFLGPIIFFGFNFFLILKLYKTFKQKNTDDTLLHLILLIGLSGFIINYLQFDSFRLTGYWLYVAWAIYLIHKKPVINA